MIDIMKVSVLSQSILRSDREYALCIREEAGLRELNADEVTFFVTEFQRLKTLLDGNELKPHMYVRICADYTRKVTDGMKTWIEVNKIRTFRIEKIEGSSIKLFGVDFWITSDLLYPIRS
jgi:hypothetical protein